MYKAASGTAFSDPTAALEPSVTGATGLRYDTIATSTCTTGPRRVLGATRCSALRQRLDGHGAARLPCAAPCGPEFRHFGLLLSREAEFRKTQPHAAKTGRRVCWRQDVQAPPLLRASPPQGRAGRREQPPPAPGNQLTRSARSMGQQGIPDQVGNGADA